MALLESPVGYSDLSAGPIDVLGFEATPPTLEDLQQYAGTVIGIHEVARRPDAGGMEGFLPRALNQTVTSRCSSLMYAFRSRGYDIASSKPDWYNPMLGTGITDVMEIDPMLQEFQDGALPIQRAARYLLTTKRTLFVSDEHVRGVLLPGRYHTEASRDAINGLTKDSILHALSRKEAWAA
jgi:hypothetical protein